MWSLLPEHCENLICGVYSRTRTLARVSLIQALCSHRKRHKMRNSNVGGAVWWLLPQSIGRPLSYCQQILPGMNVCLIWPVPPAFQ